MLVLLIAQQVLGEERRVNVSAGAHAGSLHRVLKQHRDAQQHERRGVCRRQAKPGLCLNLRQEAGRLRQVGLQRRLRDGRHLRRRQHLFVARQKGRQRQGRRWLQRWHYKL